MSGGKWILKKLGLIDLVSVGSFTALNISDPTLPAAGLYAGGKFWSQNYGINPADNSNTAGGGAGYRSVLVNNSGTDEIWVMSATGINRRTASTGASIATISPTHGKFSSIASNGTNVFAVDGQYLVKYLPAGTFVSEIQVHASLAVDGSSFPQEPLATYLAVDATNVWVWGRVTTTPTIFKVIITTMVVSSGTIGAAGNTLGPILLANSKLLSVFAASGVASLNEIDQTALTAVNRGTFVSPGTKLPLRGLVSPLNSRNVYFWSPETSPTNTVNPLWRVGVGAIPYIARSVTFANTYDYNLQSGWELSGADVVPGITPAYYTVKVVVYPPLAVSPLDLSFCTGVAITETLVATGGTGGPYSWTELGTTSLPAGITFDAPSATLSGTTSASGAFNLDVRVTDGTFTHDFTVNITVEISPTITTASPLPGGVIATPYSVTLVATGAPGVTWSIATGSLPAGLSLNPSTGEISGTPGAIGVFNFTITATSTDPGACPKNKAFQLTIASGAGITVLPLTLPVVCLGTAYSQTITAVGGTGPYTFAITSGSLPLGLTLASGGLISGMPTTVGVYAFDITATDSLAATGVRSYTIDVNDSPVIDQSTIPDACKDNAYTTTFTATGGTAPYTWSATGIPAGLTLNPSTGELSGTPTALGSFTLVIRVDQTGGGCFNQKSFTLAVSGAEFTNTLPDGCLGFPYSFQLYVSGPAPDTWVILGNNLPTGLSINGTGLVSGTPTQTGAFSLEMQATNGSGCVGTHLYEFDIHPSPSILTSSIADPIRSVPYSQSIEASFLGTPPYTWSVIAGALPTGLAINPATGVISGTSFDVPGPFTVTIRLTDSNGCTDERVYSFDLVSGGAIVVGDIPDMCSGVPVDFEIEITGGVPPYNVVQHGGNLPPGISVSLTGVVTGTPTTPGSYDFTLRVTDINLTQVDQPYTVVVSQSPTITTTALPIAFPNTAYSATITISGGTAPYTLSVEEGTLPDGLILDNSLLRIFGVPTVSGQYTFTLRATGANGCYGERIYTLFSKPPLVITNLTLPHGCESQEYSVFMEATGGTPPYFWYVYGGALPPGLSLNPGTGEIYGVPIQQGTYNFSIQVLDADYNSAVRSYQVEIRDETCGGEIRIRQRIISLESEPVVVQDPLHTDHLFEMLPAPMIDPDIVKKD